MTRKPRVRTVRERCAMDVRELCERYWQANGLVPYRDEYQQDNFWAGHMFTLALSAYYTGQRAGRRARGKR